MVDETQISKPQEYAVTLKQNLTGIFLSSVILKQTFQCEAPCILLDNNYDGMNFVFGMSIHLKPKVAWYGAIYKRRLLKGQGVGP